MMSRTSARALKVRYEHARQAAWNPAPGEKKVTLAQDFSPTTGRNTKRGRKVEKPADPKAGGPSGQRDRARHDKKHANG